MGKMKENDIKNKSRSAIRVHNFRNREIGYITYFFVALFLCLIAYLTWFMFFQSNEVINNSHNPRTDILAKKVIRGNILSREGDILATTQVDGEGGETRVYPYGAVFAHAVGYSTHGSTGVEAMNNIALLTSDMYLPLRIKNELASRKNLGNQIVTTLDVPLQQSVYEAMDGYRGAAIVTNVKTGEILSVVSKPDFDPNQVSILWDTLNADEEESCLLNRAMQGLYPPGSAFKIVTAYEYLKEHHTIEDYYYDCHGTFERDGIQINCYHKTKHGKVNFRDSFAKSCNASFASMTTFLNQSDFQKTCKQLLFNSEIPNPYSHRESFSPIEKDAPMSEAVQAGIGQGKMLVTPFHINLITQAIANEGVLMQPYVVMRIENGDSHVLKVTKPKEYSTLMSKDDAAVLNSLMCSVVEYGTAKKIYQPDKYAIAGKTGSAEYDSTNKNASHAWFTGFAPANDPQIAVTVILEREGSGGEYAAPVAKRIFDAYFK